MMVAQGVCRPVCSLEPSRLQAYAAAVWWMVDASATLFSLMYVGE